MKKYHKSIFTKMLFTFGVVMFVSVLLIESVNLYFIAQDRKRAAGLYQHSLDYYGEYLEKGLSSTCTQLLTLISQRSDNLFDLLSESEDTLDVQISKMQLQDQMQKILTTSGSGYNMFVYIPEREICLWAFDTRMSSTRKLYLQENLEEYTKLFSGNNSKLLKVSAEDEYYLLKLYKRTNGYAGVFLECNQLLNGLWKEGNETENIELRDKDGAAFMRLGELDIKRNMLTFQHQLNNTDVSIAVITEDTKFYSNKKYQIIVLCGAMLLSALLVYITLKKQNRSIFQPLESLRNAMGEFSRGNIEIRLPEYKGKPEIAELHATFNDMVGQIQHLKIQVYEEKLERERVRGNYLKVQIQPHFYVNILNLIYDFAQLDDCHSIQKLSRATAVYFRYILGQKGTLLPLKEEIYCIQNYVEIQKIRYGEKLEITMSISEGLEEQLILPLMLCTFVGNSVKHNIMLVPMLKIYIGVERFNGHTKMVVRDNGIGFDKEILDKINRNEDIEQNGEHIGIQNVKERIRIFYQEEADIQIKSSPGNTVVTIILPEAIPSKLSEEEEFGELL